MIVFGRLCFHMCEWVYIGWGDLGMMVLFSTPESTRCQQEATEEYNLTGEQIAIGLPYWTQFRVSVNFTRDFVSSVFFSRGVGFFFCFWVLAVLIFRCDFFLWYRILQGRMVSAAGRPQLRSAPWWYGSWQG